MVFFVEFWFIVSLPFAIYWTLKREKKLKELKKDPNFRREYNKKMRDLFGLTHFTK